ncbi:hypothetical protein, partial [Bacteroides acidifaciens]
MSYNKRSHRPVVPACGLYEEERSVSVESGNGSAPSFPLEVFPTAIRHIIESLHKYENFHPD